MYPVCCYLSLRSVPREAAGRVEFGHWEADTMLFGVRKQALLIPRERTSRLSLVLRPESKGAEPVAQAMVATLGALPLEMRRSVTFDNGTEFARALRVARDRDGDVLLRPA